MATKNKQTKKSRKKSKLSVVLTTLGVFVLAAALMFGGLYLHDYLTKSDESENAASDINTAPLYDKQDSTDEDDRDDSEAVYDEKDAYDASNTTTEVERDESGKKVATTILNVNENDTLYIFSGRVTNFLEEGGSCIYTISDGTNATIYTKEVLPDPKVTVCESLTIEKDTLGAGEWSAKVEYKSEDAEGASEAQVFKK